MVIHFFFLLIRTILNHVAELNPTYVGAAIGSFVAFALFELSAKLRKRREREHQNQSAYVEINHMCALFCHTIKWNIKELKNLKEKINEAISNRESVHYLINPQMAQIKQDVLLKLKRVAFIEDVLFLFMNMTDLNCIMESTVEANNIRRELLEDRRIKIDRRIEVLKDNLALIEEQIKQLETIYDKVAMVGAKGNALKDSNYWGLNRGAYTDEEKTKIDATFAVIMKEIGSAHDVNSDL